MTREELSLPEGQLTSVEPAGLLCIRCEESFPMGHFHSCEEPDPGCRQAYSDALGEKIGRVKSPTVRAALNEMHRWLCDLTWQATGRRPK